MYKLPKRSQIVYVVIESREIEFSLYDEVQIPILGIFSCVYKEGGTGNTTTTMTKIKMHVIEFGYHVTTIKMKSINTKFL